MEKRIKRTATGKTLVHFVNQMRGKPMDLYKTEQETGGNALKFYATMRFDIRANGDEIKNGTEVVGKYSTVKIKKNKLGPPLRKIQVPIIFGKGVWKSAEILDELLIMGAVIKKSSYFYLNNDVIGAGKFKTVNWIEENMDQCEEILNEHKSNKKV